MRAKSLVMDLRGAVVLWLSLGALLGCSSLQDYFPSNPPSLPNAEAVDRALKLCSLTHGGEPFHLKMSITPPERTAALPPEIGAMQAQIEVWWLNGITYRTEIRSAAFRQTRIVNGKVIQEQNTGSFYPRWIQNFVDALFDPVPQAEKLRREPGSIPVSQESHACITNAGHDETRAAQICFQGAQPLLASGVTFSRYVAYDNFTAFGNQLVPRTLINDLPANLLVRGQILLLEPLPQSAYPLLKATRYTLPAQQIRTRLLGKSEAEALLESPASAQTPRPAYGRLRELASLSSRGDAASLSTTSRDPVTVYVRTDKTGRVREAYTDRNDIYNQHLGAVARAMQLKFRPLLVDGAPEQMEAPIEMR